MSWPTSQDYNEAIQNAASSMADPELKKGEATCNALGLPVPRSGNFADVYQFKGADGKMWAIKCFTRQVTGLEERYARIDEHLSKANLRFTVGFQYLKDGIRIRGKWYPLLKMEWVEGFTLNDFVRQNADKPHYLHAMTQMWGKLAGRLRKANFAHADLQHGNVLLVPGTTTSKLGLKLIDYDGMWVPALASKHSGEVGHPNFQHPLRIKDRLYNLDVDRFPHLVIACGLRLRSSAAGGFGINSTTAIIFSSANRTCATRPMLPCSKPCGTSMIRSFAPWLDISRYRPSSLPPKRPGWMRFSSTKSGST